MIVIAGRLSFLGFEFKPVSWLAGDSTLRQTFSLRIHLVEWQSLSPICPSTIISYFGSPEASLSTSASRSIAGPTVFLLDWNKPVTPLCSLQHTKAEHRYPNPSCPSGGNLKAILNCCLASPARCSNCGEPNSARSKDSPECLPVNTGPAPDT